MVSKAAATRRSSPVWRMRLRLVILAAASLILRTAFAQSPASCSTYASVPLPADAIEAPVPKIPPACASYRSYAGIGRPVNYSEARACAWQERLAQKAGLEQNDEAPLA